MRARTYALSVVLLFACVGGIWVVANAVRLHALRAAEALGLQRLELYASTLSNAIGAHAYLPRVLARDRDIQAILAATVDKAVLDTVNRKLKTTAEESRAAAIYVMNDRGLALAASNFDTPTSFVGHSYAFRPYFAQAISGGDGHFFGVGTTSGQPGYFISAPIEIGSGIAGVVVVKVDLAPLEQEWSGGGERLLVLDEHRIAILSSDKRWKYRSEERLGSSLEAGLKATQQYGDIRIGNLDLREESPLSPSSRLVRLGGQPFLMQSRDLGNGGWTMRYFSDTAPAQAQWLSAVAIGTALCGAMVSLGLLLNQRRLRLRAELEARTAVSEALRKARDDLEQKVEERTSDLRLQVAERERAEAGLRTAQDELVHAGKMAAIGQMSAALAHEINQPLAAIQTFAASARLLSEKGDAEAVRSNLSMISELTMRMARLTQHLKMFSTKTPARRGEVPLATCVRRSLELLASAKAAAKLDLAVDIPACAVVLGDEIRVEQVILNVLRNATDAMQSSQRRRLRLSAAQAGHNWELAIADSGTGIPDAVREHIFEPFFSTKEREGLGLGLSLSLDIVREFGGSMRFENNDMGGATFYVVLPSAEQAAVGVHDARSA